MLRQKSRRYDGYGSYAPLKNATRLLQLNSRGDNLIKITGFDPHPSSDTMLRQKSRRYHGYGSYVPHYYFQELKQQLSSNCYNFNFSYIFHSAYPPYYSVYLLISTVPLTCPVRMIVPFSV
jgi:hypothetical protein